jgi:hypothetical protein
MRLHLRLPLVILSALVLVSSAIVGAASPALVTPAALQTLVPSPEGWTKVTEAAKQVTLSLSCEYALAAATFGRGAARIKATIADSDGAADCLSMLAPMIAMLPEHHQEKIGAATTLSRAPYAGLPAAERWDAIKSAGDIEVLVDGRFVVTLEGTQIASIDELRDVLKLIDVKKFAGLR